MSGVKWAKPFTMRGKMEVMNLKQEVQKKDMIWENTAYFSQFT